MVILHVKRYTSMLYINQTFDKNFKFSKRAFESASFDSCRGRYLILTLTD